jgi:PilZ domain
MSQPRLTHFRAFARRPVGLSAVVSHGDGSWKRPARLIDLGLGGACMEMHEAVPSGTAIALAVEAPHLWDPLYLEGEVVWLHTVNGAARLGVRFLHRSGRTLRTLTELLEAEAYH